MCPLSMDTCQALSSQGRQQARPPLARMSKDRQVQHVAEIALTFDGACWDVHTVQYVCVLCRVHGYTEGYESSQWWVRTLKEVLVGKN